MCERAEKKGRKQGARVPLPKILVWGKMGLVMF
jgi:hypothetical protein